MLDMVIASFLKIWHIIPIIIGIILFRKLLSSKDKKRRIKISEDHEKQGLSLQFRVGKKYEDLDYEVSYDKQQGIDVYSSKANKILLIKCNNTNKSKSILAEDIKDFIKDAKSYIQKNDLEDKEVEFRYAIVYPAVLHKSAMKILSDDTYNCKYIVV